MHWLPRGVDQQPVGRRFVGQSYQPSVKNLTAIEYGWFCETFGRPTELRPFDDDPETDLRVRSEEATQDILVFYGRVRAAGDEVIDEVGLEETGTAWFGQAVPLRWVLSTCWRRRRGTPATSTASASSSTG